MRKYRIKEIPKGYLVEVRRFFIWFRIGAYFYPTLREAKDLIKQKMKAEMGNIVFTTYKI